MHAILHSAQSAARARPPDPPETAAFRKPSYDCRDQQDAIKLVVYVPGVDASGVDIEARGTDLAVTARKTRFVKVNWQALNLEAAQRDYRLALRLGGGLAFEAMRAEIHNGVLTVTVPKRHAESAPAAPGWARVA